MPNRDRSKANLGMDLEKHLDRMHKQWLGQLLPGGRIVGGRGVVVIKVPTEVSMGRRRDEDGQIDGESVRFNRAAKTVDFMGCLEDGDAVALEAKRTTGHRFPLARVTPRQAAFMRAWGGVGLLILKMVDGQSESGWAVPFRQFLEALDSGTKSWPLPGRENARRKTPEQNLSDVGVRLTSGFDWHRALRSGRLDDYL